MKKHLSRRRFIRTAATGLALPWFIPSSVRGANAPSNRITIGFIGMGTHGVEWNLIDYLKRYDARVLMVCDVDGHRMRRAKKLVDARYDNEDCATSKDFRDVIARKDLDAVLISTPDHWHTLISIQAARAGKDVQCEKPTLTIGEGRILIETIRKYGRVFQTSTEDRSLPMYHRMAELVRNGRIGKLQKIEVLLPRAPKTAGDPTPQPVPPDFDYDMWLGPAPNAPYTKDRCFGSFRYIWDYSGGVIVDWGAHLFDTAQWANDTERSGPVEVESTGTLWEGGLYNTPNDYNVTFRYANGVIMTCAPGSPSLKFIGSDGWVCNRAGGLCSKPVPRKSSIPSLVRTTFTSTQTPKGNTMTSSSASRVARTRISPWTSATGWRPYATWPISRSGLGASSSGTPWPIALKMMMRLTPCFPARCASRGLWISFFSRPAAREKFQLLHQLGTTKMKPTKIPMKMSFATRWAAAAMLGLGLLGSPVVGETNDLPDFLVYAKDGSGVYGHKNSPKLPWCEWRQYDPDRPAPKRVDPGKAGPPAPVPADAIVLFDGKNLDQWQPTDHTVQDGCIVAPVKSKSMLNSKQEFGDVQIHLEWMAPAGSEAPWDERGNNGVLLMGRYEIQILRFI